MLQLKKLKNLLSLQILPTANRCTLKVSLDYKKSTEAHWRHLAALVQTLAGLLCTHASFILTAGRQIVFGVGNDKT